MDATSADQLTAMMRQRGDDLRRAAEESRLRAKLHREQAAMEAARGHQAVVAHRSSPQRGSPVREIRTVDASDPHYRTNAPSMYTSGASGGGGGGGGSVGYHTYNHHHNHHHAPADMPSPSPSPSPAIPQRGVSPPSSGRNAPPQRQGYGGGGGAAAAGVGGYLPYNRGSPPPTMPSSVTSASPPAAFYPPPPSSVVSGAGRGRGAGESGGTAPTAPPSATQEFTDPQVATDVSVLLGGIDMPGGGGVDHATVTTATSTVTSDSEVDVSGLLGGARGGGGTPRGAGRTAGTPGRRGAQRGGATSTPNTHTPTGGRASRGIGAAAAASSGARGPRRTGSSRAAAGGRATPTRAHGHRDRDTHTRTRTPVSGRTHRAGGGGGVAYDGTAAAAAAAASLVRRVPKGSTSATTPSGAAAVATESISPGKRVRAADPLDATPEDGPLLAAQAKPLLDDVLRRLSHIEQVTDSTRSKVEEQHKQHDDERLKRLETDNAVLREQIKALLRSHPLVTQVGSPNATGDLNATGTTSATTPHTRSPTRYVAPDSPYSHRANRERGWGVIRGGALTPPRGGEQRAGSPPGAALRGPVVPVAAVCALVEDNEAAAREGIESMAAYTLKGLLALAANIALRLRAFEEAAFVCQRSLVRLEDALQQNVLMLQEPEPRAACSPDIPPSLPGSSIAALVTAGGAGSGVLDAKDASTGGGATTGASGAPPGKKCPLQPVRRVQPPTPPVDDASVISQTDPLGTTAGGAGGGRTLAGARYVESQTSLTGDRARSGSTTRDDDKRRILERLREVEEEARRTEQKNAELRARIEASREPNPPNFPFTAIKQ